MTNDTTLKNLNTYLGLCAEVYDLSKPDAPKEAYAFYQGYAKMAKGRILEPMCGTGRFLIPLLKEGFDIHGFDASQHMLDQLQKKDSAKNLSLTVWHGFAQNLNRPEKYALIFIPSGSFCLITDESEARIVLKALYNHLIESGVLLFEVETINAVPELGSWRGSMWPKPDGTTILLSQLATLDGGICKSLGKYELISENKIIHTEIEEYQLRIYEQDNLMNMLKDSGFQNICRMKAFDSRKQPSANDDSVVYECKK